MTTTPVESTVKRQVRIRACRPEDHKTVAELFLAGMRSYITPEVEHLVGRFEESLAESVNGDLASIQETYFDKGGFFWVATVEEDEKEVVVGMVGLDRKADNDGELRRLSVKGGYRGYGIGRLLVNHLEEWAREHGFARLSLGTSNIMDKAIKLYMSVGYNLLQTKLVMEDPPIMAYSYEKLLA